MINPSDITNFNRTESELEEFLLFCILVAGKNSKVAAKKLNEFLKDGMKLVGLPSDTSPFQYIQYVIDSEFLFFNILQLYKLGQYNRIGKAFYGILKFKGSLQYISIPDLESVHGIGPKTARFFLLHTRPNQKVAVLDTHILKWLRAQGYNAPKVTPPAGLQYQTWEHCFLSEARKLDMSPADLDLTIWNSYAKV